MNAQGNKPAMEPETDKEDLEDDVDDTELQASDDDEAHSLSESEGLPSDDEILSGQLTAEVR